jgi:hypothetical protein
MAEPRVRLFTLAAERWDACGGGLVRIAGALLTVAPEDAPGACVGGMLRRCPRGVRGLQQ